MSWHRKESEDKQLAISAQCDFPITKGAVWFKLLGLSTTNQDGYRGIPHDSEFIFGPSFDDIKLEL